MLNCSIILLSKYNNSRTLEKGLSPGLGATVSSLKSKIEENLKQLPEKVQEIPIQLLKKILISHNIRDKITETLKNNNLEISLNEFIQLLLPDFSKTKNDISAYFMKLILQKKEIVLEFLYESFKLLLVHAVIGIQNIYLPNRITTLWELYVNYFQYIENENLVEILFREKNVLDSQSSSCKNGIRKEQNITDSEFIKKK